MAKKRVSKRSVSRRNVKKKNVKKGQPLLLPWLPLIGQSLVIMALVFGCMRLLDVTRDAVMTHPKFSLNSNSLKIAMPQWIKAEYKLDVDLSDVFENKTIFEPDIKEEIISRFENHYLVSEVKAVDLQLPNRISMAMVLRRPVAKIKQGNKLYFIDKEGVVLPSGAFTDSTDLSLELLPMVTSNSKEKLRLGEQHPSDHVCSAISLLGMWQQRRFEKIKVLEISCVGLEERQRGGRPDYIFYIYNGVRHIELFFDKGENRGEIKLDQALDNLQRIVFRYGDLAPVTSHVDLRGTDPLIY